MALDLAFDDAPVVRNLLADWFQSLEEKLDWAALFQRLTGFVPDEWQAEALYSTAPTVALKVGRQAGKSQVLAVRAAAELRKPRTCTLIMCPAERQARLIAKKI